MTFLAALSIAKRFWWVALLPIGFAGGWKVRDWRCDSAELARVTAENEARERGEKIAYDASASFEDTRADIAETTGEVRTVIREIYRETPANVDCAVPPPVVDVLRRARDAANRAASGESGTAVHGDSPAAEPAD